MNDMEWSVDNAERHIILENVTWEVLKALCFVRVSTDVSTTVVLVTGERQNVVIAKHGSEGLEKQGKNYLYSNVDYDCRFDSVCSMARRAFEDVWNAMGFVRAGENEL